jgi:hypothetical protein
MRLAIWIVFGLASAAWTGVLGLFAWAAKAGIGLLDRVGGQGLGDLVSQWSLPAWMVSTFDLGWLQSVQVMLLQLLEWFGSFWGAAELLTGVMIATWLVWGTGLSVLLVIAVVGHWLAGPSRAAPGRAASAS